MSSASQRKAAFISQKVNFLKDQEDLLIDAVGQYVSKIIASGESWTERGDKKIEYLELCQMMDTAVEFLCKMYEELSDAPVGVPANKISIPSDAQHDLTLQPTTQQPSSSMTFNRAPTETLQSADEVTMKTALARIAVIEEALCSFRSNAETNAEQKSSSDQQMKELLSKFSAADKKNNSRFTKVKEQISEISDKHVALDQEYEARLHSLEKQLQRLSRSHDKMQVEMGSQAELREKLVHVPDHLESVKENLDALEARIGRIIDDCSNTHQDIDNIRVIVEGQDQKTTFLRELETSLQTLEADSERNLKDTQKQVEKMEANFRILCHMLNDRLTPLEQLRTSLNRQASKRDENIEKLFQVIQDVAVMSPRLQQLETKSQTRRCGFTAVSWFSKLGGGTIRPYSAYTNVGTNFNEDTGIFTAPVDGLYVASISVYLWERGELKVSVRYNKQGIGHISDTAMCDSSVTVKETTACSANLIDMKAGDTLFSDMHAHKNVRYNTVYFSCFLLA